MPGIYEFIKWVSEVIYTGEVNNEWYYQMISDYDTPQEFLAVFAYQLMGIFS